MSSATVTLGGVLWLGVLAGLATLARTENVLWVAAVCLWLVWATRRIEYPLVAAAVAAGITAPWILWNLARFGTVVQVSGAAKAAFHLYNPLPAITGFGGAARSVYEIFAHSTQFVVGEEFIPRSLTPFVLGANALVILIAVAGAGRARLPMILLPFGTFLLLHIAYYAFVQHSYFNWYFLSIVLVGAVLQGERVSHAPAWLRFATLAANVILCVGTLSFFMARYPFQPKASEAVASPVISELTLVRAGGAVGGWNMGRVGYFGEWSRPDLRFFNLDCVVNNQLFEAWKRGHYSDWIRENVQWLTEEPQGPVDRGIAAPTPGRVLWIVKPSATARPR